MQRKHINKAKLIELHGNKCINCGSSEEIEWHHVVPLEVGGNDIESNIVPLCYYCHKAVTHNRLILMTQGRPHRSGGRKRRLPPDYKSILNAYLECKIGKQECVMRFGLSKTNHLTDNVWFKEFLKENHIIACRNNIDMKNADKNNGIKIGDCVGYAKYTDGTFEYYFWGCRSYRGDEQGREEIAGMERSKAFEAYIAQGY